MYLRLPSSLFFRSIFRKKIAKFGSSKYLTLSFNDLKLPLATWSDTIKSRLPIWVTWYSFSLINWCKFVLQVSSKLSFSSTTVQKIVLYHQKGLSAGKKEEADQIIRGMLPHLNNLQLRYLQDILKKNISTLGDGTEELSNQELLAKYFAAKRAEGCSEKSLTYYRATNC